MKSSLTWTVLGAILNKIISVLVFLYIAQFLLPEDFGLFAIALVIVGFLKVFIETGYKEAIIYYQIKDNKQLSFILMLLSVVSALLFFILIYSSNVVSDYMGGGVKEAILYLSFLLLLSPFRVISLSNIEQKMAFESVVKIEFLSLLISSVIGTILASYDFGLMSLIVMSLSNQFLQVCFLYKVSDFNLSWWERSSGKKINHIHEYSAHLILIGLVNYISENLDKIIIGRSFEKSDMGLYDRSIYLSQMPAMLISTAISRVFFSKMAESRGHLDKVRVLHVNSLPIICFIGFPFLGVLCLFSQEIIFVLLGPNWMEMSTLLSIMSVIGMLRILGFYNANIYKALGEAKLQNKINIVLKSILIIFVIIGANIGLVELACCILFARLLNLIITLYTVSSLLKYKFWQMIKWPFSVMSYLFLYMISFELILKNTEMTLSFMEVVFTLFVFLFVYFILGLILFSRLFKRLIYDVKTSTA